MATRIVFIFCISCAATGCIAPRWSQYVRVHRSACDISPKSTKYDDVGCANRYGQSAIQAVSYEDETLSLSPSPTDASSIQESLPTPAGTTEQLTPATSGQGVTLELLESWAIANNPTLTQALASLQKAEGIRCQVGLLPNPSIGYSGAEIGDEGRAGQNGIYLSQLIVTGGKLAANRKVLWQDVRALRYEIESQQFRVVTDVRQRFIEGLSAQQRLAIAHDFRTVAEKGVELANLRMRAKEGGRPDVIQAEILLNEVDLIIRKAENDRHAAKMALAAFVNFPDLVDQELIGALETRGEQLDPDLVMQGLLAASPQLQVAEAQLCRAKLNVDRQYRQKVPNPEFQVGASYDSATDDPIANVQLDLPVMLFNRNQGNIQAARAEIRRARLELERIQLDLKSRLSLALRDYNNALNTMDQYRSEILPKADESLRLSEEAYVAGEFEFLRILIARKQYFDAHIQFVLAATEFALAEAEIDGMLLTGGLQPTLDFEGDDGLRGSALNSM